MNQAVATLALSSIAALCGMSPALGQIGPGPNAFFLARGPGPDCGPGIVTMQAGAPPLSPPGMLGLPPVQVPGQFRLGPHESDTPITHEPYSAAGTTETVQTLADGNRIVHTNTSHYYRDSAGRTRTDVTLSAVGPLTLDQASTVVMIGDPVARRRVILHPDLKRAEVIPYPPASGSAAGGAANSAGPAAATSSTAAPAAIRCTPPANAPAPTTTALGQKTLAGLTAKGTRVEFTIPAGQIGNEQAITVTSEEWVSDELGVVLSSTQHDPMIGDTQFHLDQIERVEPDSSLFAVPADYTVNTVTLNKPVVIQR